MVSMTLKSSSTVRLSALCSGCFGNVVPSGASLCNQHHAKPCLAFHHPSVSIRSLFERNCFDHRPNILEDTEGQGVLENIRPMRSEEHTSELQSLRHLVCRLLLEKK